MPTTSSTRPGADALDELPAVLTGFGILALVVWPLALPLIALTAVLVLVLALAVPAVIAATVVGALLAPPIALLRHRRRRRARP